MSRASREWRTGGTPTTRRGAAYNEIRVTEVVKPYYLFLNYCRKLLFNKTMRNSIEILYSYSIVVHGRSYRKNGHCNVDVYKKVKCGILRIDSSGRRYMYSMCIYQSSLFILSEKGLRIHRMSATCTIRSIQNQIIVLSIRKQITFAII